MILRKAKLPAKINPPSRANTVILIPMADGRIWYPCARGLMDSIPYVNGIIDYPHSSLITLARNRLVNGFLRLPKQTEWAIMIDSDIGFIAQDLRFLLELQHTEDFAAFAPYARKDDSGKSILRGLGFARVHRSVIELIRDEIAVPFQHEGAAMHDFFITGATSSGGFLGEDSGFWWLCSQVGVLPRVEQRCSLVHWGAAAFRLPEIELAPIERNQVELPGNLPHG